MTNRGDKALQKAVEELAEYFDSVQIFVTKYEGGQNDATHGKVAGRGNLFARISHIEVWLNKVINQLTDDGNRPDNNEENDEPENL